MFKLAMGSTVTDSITGFSGVVIARCEYLNGCLQYEVQPQALHEGKPVEAKWLDEQRLTEGCDERQPGGPGDIPPAFSHPEQQ